MRFSGSIKTPPRHCTRLVVIPSERRLERLASPLAEDRRITYGCIKVPRPFFKDVVSPLFRSTSGVVYVLPETRPSRAVFGVHADPEQTNPPAGGMVASP